MSYNFPKVKLNEEGLFGPTGNNNYYKPVYYHAKTAEHSKHKTKWALKQNEQYEAFRVCDESDWRCLNNNGLFSILDKGDVIMGANEERLSFFPNPVNENDAFHGFPINSGEYEPSTELVDKWLEEDIIDTRIHIKILKGQL